ncbi:DUF5363 family protein [Ferrimonas sp. YFM]|nr:DUF5363 family protein [Ferrimonas sp. YFM]BDY03864.1 hypothetical protein F0521_09050 [Ferrimonas sp. YFM]
MGWIKRWWRAYCAWCDANGLSPEHKRSCVPRTKEPSPEKSPRPDAD